MSSVICAECVIILFKDVIKYFSLSPFKLSTRVYYFFLKLEFFNDLKLR